MACPVKIPLQDANTSAVSGKSYRRSRDMASNKEWKRCNCAVFSEHAVVAKLRLVKQWGGLKAPKSA